MGEGSLTMDEKTKKYERLFFTRTGFGLKKKYHKEVVAKLRKLAKKEAEWKKEMDKTLKRR